MLLSTKILESWSFGIMVLAPLLIIVAAAFVIPLFFGRVLPAVRSRPKPSVVPQQPQVELPSSSKLALLRLVHEETKASMGLCKRALEETNYDMQKAVTLLQVTSSSKNMMVLRNGRVHAAVFGNVAVLVEVNCETSFAAQSPQFGCFVQDLCMQISAGNPSLIGRDYFGASLDPFSSIPPPPPADDSSILLNQVSIIPDHKGKTVKQVLTDLSDRLGEEIVIRRFVRYELGA